MLNWLTSDYEQLSHILLQNERTVGKTSYLMKGCFHKKWLMIVIGNHLIGKFGKNQIVVDNSLTQGYKLTCVY